MKSNISGLVKLIEFAKTVGASVSLIHPIAFDKSQDEENIHEDRDSLNHLIRIREKAENEGVEIVKIPSIYPEKITCSDPFLSPMISIEGDFYSCCYIYEGRGDGISSFREYYLGEHLEVPMHQYVMGNVFRDNIMEIWKGKRFDFLRKKISRTQKPRRVSPGELKMMRKSINLSKAFSYCEVCLFRWSCAC